MRCEDTKVDSADVDPPAPAGHGPFRRVVDWLFVDRRTGGYTVAQWPNVALWAFLAATAALRVFHPAGTVGTVLRVVEDGSLLVWAGDELLRGVNPFRRLLGVVVLAATVVGLVRHGW